MSKRENHREDVAGLHDVLGARVARHRDLHGARPVGRRDAGADAVARVDRDRVRGAARVLVVDDHPVNREVLTRQLGILGIAADTAVDGHDGLAAWRAGQDPGGAPAAGRLPRLGRPGAAGPPCGGLPVGASAPPSAPIVQGPGGGLP